MRPLYLRFRTRYRPKIVLLVPHVKRLIVEPYVVLSCVKVQQLVSVSVIPHVILFQLHPTQLLVVVYERRPVVVWSLRLQYRTRYASYTRAHPF